MILKDHGDGLGGAITDWNPCCVDMPLRNLSDAFNTATSNGVDKIDVLYMDACLMGTIEGVYQARDSVDYCVGKENTGWATAVATSSTSPE